MPESDGAVQLIGDGLIAQVLDKARRSTRLRANHNFHSGAEANPQRFLNVLVEGTYIAPHRHRDPPKTESFLVLEGCVAVLCFDDNGAITDRYLVGSGSDAKGIDLPAGVWHTIAAVTPHAVCFEVKPGPWDPATDKEFASWAPMEGDPGAPAYLASLL